MHDGSQVLGSREHAHDCVLGDRHIVQAGTIREDDAPIPHCREWKCAHSGERRKDPTEVSAGIDGPVDIWWKDVEPGDRGGGDSRDGVFGLGIPSRGHVVRQLTGEVELSPFRQCYLHGRYLNYL